jgi:uncharacterized membrane protein
MAARIVAVGAALMLSLPAATGFTAGAMLRPQSLSLHSAPSWDASSSRPRPWQALPGRPLRRVCTLPRRASVGEDTQAASESHDAKDTSWEVTAAAPGWKVTALCAVGAALALYALYLDGAVAAADAGAKSFKAGCDFGGAASCSTVARSQFATGLGLINPRGPIGFLALPNSIYGLVYVLPPIECAAPGFLFAPSAALSATGC